MIGRRRALRQVLQQDALAASTHNADLKVFATDRLRKDGKPHEVVFTNVDRKFTVIFNVLCKAVVR